MNKKTIVSLLLVGMLVFAAGMGTYAWFTSEASSSENTVTTGEFKIHLNEEYEAGANFENILPGEPTETIAFRITNDGDYDLAMLRKFEFTGDKALAKHLFVTTFNSQDWDETIDLTNNEVWLGSEWDLNRDGNVSLYELATRKGEFSTEGWEMIGLKPNEYQKVEIGFTLDPDAGNKFQNKSAGLRIKAKGLQINAEAIENELGEDLISNPVEVLKEHIGRERGKN